MSRRDIVVLAVLTSLAFAVRLWWSGALLPAPAWSDPDGYAELSRTLVRSHHWQWTPGAIRFAEFTKAPLYQVLLSGVWRAEPHVTFVSAALGLHALLNALTPLALYLIAATLHSRRAGLVAAVAYTAWAPNILPTATLWQEQLFIPALCWALAGAAIAVTTRRRGHWVVAGLLFGAGALTRSSITYFVLPAAIVLAWSPPPRQTTIGEAGLFLAGFAVLVLPYTLYVSAVTGRWTLIESVGYFSLKRFFPVSPADPAINLLTMMHDPAGPPTTAEVLRFLLRDFTAAPIDFLLRRLDYVRLLVKPPGAALLANAFTATARSAGLLRAAVHLLLDAPFAAALLLAPAGAVLARERRIARMLMLWPPVYLGLVAVMLWAGTRYRAPVEPILIVLAAVVVSGEWQRPTRGQLGAAALVTSAVALMLAISIPSTFAARANYGVGATPAPGAAQRFDGAMGAFVTCVDPVLNLALRSETAAPIRARVSLDGRAADEFTFSGEVARRYPLTAPRRIYVEVAAADGTRIWIEPR